MPRTGSSRLVSQWPRYLPHRLSRHRDGRWGPGKIGAIAIDDSRTSPVDQVLDETGGLGADRGCVCVGY